MSNETINSSTVARFRPETAETPHQCLCLYRGFTLIEILIVVMIVGIATALASANLFQSDEEKLQQESEKLLAVMQRARDEAALGGRIIAVSLEANEIRFLERDIVDPTRWRATGIEQLSARTLPETFHAQIRMGAMSANDEAKDARVVFLPVGVAAPFELALHSPAGRRRIAADAIGNLRLFKDPA